MIIAHSPLATALKGFCLHTHAELEPRIAAFDVPPDLSRENCLAKLKAEILSQLPAAAQWLICTDIFGASPYFISQQLAQELGSPLLVGSNAPMLLRACTYLDLPLTECSQKALEGGQRGVLLAP